MICWSGNQSKSLWHTAPLPTSDQIGPVCLFLWWATCSNAGDLNAKHVDWKSRLSKRRGKLIHDYANENTYLIFHLDTPNTIPYNLSATPDVLDIVITKDLASPVHLTSCFAQSLDHLPILIDTMCHSSFFHPLDDPDFRRTD
jgi:hypothetical protein